MPKGVYPHTHIKPKVYPTAMVEQVRELYYNRGMTQDEIGEVLGVTQRVVWRLMRNHQMPTREQVKRDQRGPANTTWKGDQAGYQALHVRVAVARGKPKRCERCGTTDPRKRYEWANLTGQYDDVNDYERMCVSCHRAFDAARRRAEVVR